jgi:hypothetical protein
MNRQAWSDACRVLRDRVEREFEELSFEGLSPNEFKRQLLEAECRFRQVVMERDESDKALFLGKQGTPVLALIGLLASVVVGIALFLRLHDWLAAR